MIAAVPPCRVEVLNVRFGGGQGAAGHIFRTIVFTNTGPVRCTLRGYPGVSSVDAQGHQIGAPATREGASPRTVVLAPGRSASVVYELAQALIYPNTTCRPVTARALRIYPPDETRWRILAYRHLACSRTVAGASSIGVVVPGISGQ